MATYLGRFDEAARDLAQALEQDPGQDFWAYIYLTLQAYRGDREAMRPAAREALRRFGESPKPEVRERTAKGCAALPGAVDDPAALVKLADFAVSFDAKHPFIHWFKMAKAMAEYRAGRDEAAAAAGGDALAAMAQAKTSGLPVATCHYVRALALHRLGRGGEAKAAYDQAEQVLGESDLIPGRDDLIAGGGIENWFICHALRREAREALGVTAP